LARKWGLIL